jgi:flagellar M-ring protein FliF
VAGLGTMFGQLGAEWRGWPPGRRLYLVLGSVVGIGGMLGLILWGSQVAYAPLLTNLSSEDAAQVAAVLDKDRVPYQIGEGGTALLVPEDQVHRLRLKVAGEGIPKGGGVGFELFQGNALGMSRFAEQINYRRALEGELQRTIRTLDAVRDARVHIVVAERRLFKEEAARARASVTLHLHHGRRLAGEQVQAIIHLVASSVPDLSPENITVIDGSGAVLAKGGDAEAAGTATFDQQRAIERGMEERVTEILERTVGSGKVSVRVAAEVDATRTERTTESFDPDGAVLRSEQTSSEQRQVAAGQAAAGVPGARSNLLGVAGPALGPETGSGKMTQTKNYEITKTVSHEVRATGRLKRLSVAVLVDEATPAASGQAGTPRSTEDLAKLSDVVKKAVGFDESRGDQVVVQSAPFQVPEVGAAGPDGPPVWLPWVEKLGRPVVAGIAVLLLAAFVLRRRRNPLGVRQELLAAPRTVRELEAAMIASPSTALGRSFDAIPALPSRSADPNRAAGVLRGWLEEHR